MGGSPFALPVLLWGVRAALAAAAEGLTAGALTLLLLFTSNWLASFTIGLADTIALALDLKIGLSPNSDDDDDEENECGGDDAVDAIDNGDDADECMLEQSASASESESESESEELPSDGIAPAGVPVCALGSPLLLLLLLLLLLALLTLALVVSCHLFTTPLQDTGEVSLRSYA
jgi:hypothetical protein